MVRDRGCECSIPSQFASFSPTCSLNLYLAKNSTLLFSSNSTLICKSSRGVGVPLCRLDRPVATITVFPSWFTNHGVPLQPVALGATIGKAREFFPIRGNNCAALGV